MSQLPMPPIHGRETYAVYYGDGHVLKRPLPHLTPAAKDNWLTKQHRTKNAIDEIRAVGNPVYNVPKMIYINDDEFQILEERAPGQPLTNQLYNNLTKRQKAEIITSIASFLVDMNELKPVHDITSHKISDEIKFSRLDSFINNKMSYWFSQEYVNKMARIRDEIGNFEYSTRRAWSHSDLNPGNVLYDAENSKIYFIDFAECSYQFIYHDIFSPLQIELGLCSKVYQQYTEFHNEKLYQMPGSRNEMLRAIMCYRIIGVYLKRFIKASDDLRMNPQNDKSEKNNQAKIIFMHEQIKSILELENTIGR